MTRVMTFSRHNHDSSYLKSWPAIPNVSDMETTLPHSLNSPDDRKARLPVTWWGILIRVVVGVSVLLIANFIRVPVHQFSAARLPADESAQLLADSLIFLITPIIVIAVVSLWFRRVERIPLAVTGLLDLRRILPGILGGMLLIALATALGWAGLALLGQQLQNPPDELGGTGLGASTGALLFFMFVRAYLLQGLPEELLYRGWFFSLTRSRPWLTFWWTTLAFTVIHVTSAGGQQSVLDHLYYLALPLGMGLLAGAVVLWRGSMWWAVGTHGGMHVCLPVASIMVPMSAGPLQWLVPGLTQALVAGGVLLLWRLGRDGGQPPVRSMWERA